jgi:hypothetical protein
MKSFIVATLLLVAYVSADMYMHNPRGSNDRLNEANTNRNNANRLFDSQNNAKGGYCYAPAMSYYEGSLLSVEWTAQHGCGPNPKVQCNIVLQYMCGDSDAAPKFRIRDGATTDTITDDENGPTATDNNGELLYGMHENYDFYHACETRDRNMGLFISDREKEGGLTAGRAAAIFTRQNNNGDRHGYECPEERDYYPYWQPSPWKDIVILTHNMDYCDFYQSESQNVKSKNWCRDPKDNSPAKYNNEAACKINGMDWTSDDSYGLDPPECMPAPISRENHLGNGEMTGFNNMYNWTLPRSDAEGCIGDDNCNCVLRIRYNISSGELNNRPDDGFTDYTSNGEASPVKNDDTPVLKQGMNFSMAMDTTQYGRTFQDRSYVFHIRPRPSGVLSTNRIFNLNVRGKRGNIVQAYPATEYDFTPQFLHVRVGDYIHFQWTGCDTNPAGNAGEGTDQTDRSNIVQIENFDEHYPASDSWIDDNKALFEDEGLRRRMAMLDQVDCLNYEQLLAKNGGNEGAADADVQNCMKLNAAPQYFDGGLVKMNTTNDDGYFYMSSRNNNFTNRDQKGVIYVDSLLPVWAIVIVVIGSFLFIVAGVIAGMMLYAKSHPHSNIANIFAKL